jgi:hypothetical protein
MGLDILGGGTDFKPRHVKLGQSITFRGVADELVDRREETISNRLDRNRCRIFRKRNAFQLSKVINWTSVFQE